MEGGGRGRATRGRGGSWQGGGRERGEGGRRRGGGLGSHEGPRGGDGEESGKPGPGAQGSSPHYAAAVRSAVPASPAESPGPAAPAPPPLSPPPTGPAPPRPVRSLLGAPATPCASAGLQNVWAPYPTTELISRLGALCPLGGRERDRNTAGGRDSLGERDKEAETRTEIGTGVEGERKGERCGGQLCLPSAGPFPSCQKGRQRGGALSLQGTSPTPSRVARPYHPGSWGNGSRHPEVTDSPSLPSWGALQEPSDPTWGNRAEAQQRSPHLLLPPQGPCRGFFPRDEGQQGNTPTLKAGFGAAFWGIRLAPYKHSNPAAACSSLREAPSPHPPTEIFRRG